MDKLKASRFLCTLSAIMIVFAIFTANGQISTPCTSSMFSSFTPCINYLTGSSGNGSSPTEDCCNSFKTLISDGLDCLCLIVTGNVPISIPFGPALAISLPRACHSRVPVISKASGVPLPAPGPALFVPSPAPRASAPRHSARVHKPPASAPAPTPKGKTGTAIPSATNNHTAPKKTSSATSPEPHDHIAPIINPGIRPVVTLSAAAHHSVSLFSLPSFLLIILAMVVC